MTPPERREVGADREQRAVVQREHARGGGREALAEVLALLREQVRAGRDQLAHLGQRVGRSEGDEGRPRRHLGRPARGPRQQRGLQSRAALGAEQRLQPGLDLARARRLGHDQRRRAGAGHCSKRYTTPGGASSAASRPGSAARRTAANVAVLSPISRISSGTGVGSGATPFAWSVA